MGFHWEDQQNTVFFFIACYPPIHIPEDPSLSAKKLEPNFAIETKVVGELDMDMERTSVFKMLRGSAVFRPEGGCNFYKKCHV